MKQLRTKTASGVNSQIPDCGIGRLAPCAVVGCGNANNFRCVGLRCSLVRIQPPLTELKLKKWSNGGKVQKFNKGDHVKVIKDLGSGMGHFQSDCEAIVIGSCADQYGGNDTNSYTLHIKDFGQVSWYYEHQAELIEANRVDLLELWEAEAKKESEIKSDLDWIFANGEEVLKNAHGASISALARCFGLTDLWGGRGEGFIYYSNAMATLLMAKPYLEAGDKNGWLQRCAEM